MTSTVKTDKYLKVACRYCNAKLGEAFLDLGSTPLANSFLEKDEAEKQEFECPLKLVRCTTCGLVQLTHVVPADLMFSTYLYVSSTTKTFQKHFAEYAQSVRKRLFKKTRPLAVDIGSNDGLLLACYQKEDMRAIGIDPAANLAEEANQKGLMTINDYFGPSSVNKILSEYGKADVISGNNVFAHIDDIQNVLRNVKSLLDEKGIFVIEFPYLVTMLEKMFFDMIYHEHLSYIGITPLQYVLNRFDMEIFAIEEVSSHGGSLRIFCQNKDAGYTISPDVKSFLEKEEKEGYNSQTVYNCFADKVYRVKETLNKFVSEAKKKNQTISGYGAPAKSTTLINFCDLSKNQIDYIVDDNPLKQETLAPGSKIPIVSSEHLHSNPTDIVIIFAWNFADEIIKKLEPLRQKGVKFIVPLPEPRIV
jgi:SAM-dependent methyltransferase